MNNIGKIIAITFSLLLYISWYIIFGWDTHIFLFSILYSGLAFLLGISYDQLKNKAERDELTNAYNRLFVNRTLSKKKFHHVTICIVDVNHFKQINDQLGHAVGDVVLQTICKTISKNIRKNDLVIRWGGDEFLLVFPDCNYIEIDQLMDRINKELSSFSQKINMPVSVSIGGVRGENNENLHELIEKADKHMYKIKKQYKSFQAANSFLT